MVDPERTALIESMLIAGAMPADVARMAEVEVATVYRINKKLREKVAHLTNYQEQVLVYLKEQLNAVTNQARLFGDAEYLRTQPLSELRHLHNDQFRIAAHLIEALSPPDDAEPVAQLEGPSGRDGVIEGTIVETVSEESPGPGVHGAN